MPVPIARRRSAPRVSSGRWPNSPTYGWCPSRRSIANPLLSGPQVWHSRMQGRPVNELLDVPVERPTVDQLKIEVGRTKKDRVVTRLTGDHGKDGQLDSVDEGHQRPVHRQAAVRAQRHRGFLLEPGDDVDGITIRDGGVRPIEGCVKGGRHHGRGKASHPGDPQVIPASSASEPRICANVWYVLRPNTIRCSSS